MKINKNIENLFLEKITGLNRNQLFLYNYTLTDFQKSKLNSLKKLYLSGFPLEYILKEAEFYGLKFYVDSRVLIPRNDTEILVKNVIDTIKQDFYRKKFVLLDIGTGSGCIPISIFKNLNDFSNRFYALDISKKALEVAKKNILKYSLQENIKTIQVDLLKKEDLFKGILDKNIIITANLPYIKDGDFVNISESVIKYEPNLALYGGKNTGFELYEKLIFHILDLKKNLKINKIILFIEIGFDQKEVSKKFLLNYNLEFKYFKDNMGIDRCIKINF